MSTKISKKIRKKLGYYPTMKRSYHKNHFRKAADGKTLITSSVRLLHDDPRAIYQRAKAMFHLEGFTL